VTALIGLLILLAAAPGRSGDLAGQVVDAVTGKPIPGAHVTSDEHVVETDTRGGFRLTSAGETLRVRAPGYRRQDVAARELTAEIKLTPFVPRALYLSFFGVGAPALRAAALRLLDETELNAVVIDVKGDRGMVSYRSGVPLAAQVGAQDIITIRDVRALLAELKQKGIYTVARIVVFKDNPLAQRRRDLAVKTPAGRLWRDREDLAWTDPFRREVWEYNIALAMEAARHGFDEIQFDYVRFPDAPGLAYSQPSTEEARVRAVEGFLAEARRRLVPFNVFLAADIFGYVCWNPGDTGIGQTLETFVSHLDYVSPMVYPSAYQFGIPGYRNPVAHPYEIVSLTLARARNRTGLPPGRFRPWLQAFRDYAFDRRPFGAAEIRSQISAAETFGANGWMLWNPRNTYGREGLKAK
jgi:hypothetical protein